MKTLHLSIIVTLILIVPAIQNVIAMPNLSPQDLYKASEMVFYGQVISKQAGPGPDYYYYQVKVQTYFKNPQTSDSITVAGHKPSEGHVTYPQFEIGDKAIFYINKLDGSNTISPYSQKAGDACDMHSFLGAAPLPGEPTFMHGPPADNPRLLDINGNALVRPILTNEEIVLSYDGMANNYPESRMVPVEVSIKNEDNGQQVFNKTQNLQMQACSLAGTLKWNFVPTEIGNYDASIVVDGKTKTAMSFNVIFDSTAPIPQSMPSPLKQFKSGISAKDVKCKEGLQLVIKTEDGSPACVKPETATNLIQSGWATVITNPSDNSVTKTPYDGIDKPSGIILLGNQTYYMTTFNGTLDSIPSNGTEISFYGVLFTLLRPPESNANGLLYVVDVKFTNDNTNESLVIYPVGVGAVQADKVLSKHVNPQVGFIVYQYNTIKLLVSTDNQASSAIKLYLSTDSDIIKPGQSIGITISVNNTLATPVDIPAQNNWSYPNVSTGPCETINYGISILDGFYDASNVTQGKSLNLFDPGILCPFIQETAKVYEFQPHSGDVKQVQCKPIEGLQCPAGSYQMGQNYKFNGYWDQGMVQPFKSGIYTLVGADEWDHVAIVHFVVTNSTIFAGGLGTTQCPAMFGGVQFSATIKNSTGFAHYYNSTQYGHTFFLHPGMQGTISVQYTSSANAAWLQNNGNAPFNMTNGAALFYMANATNGKMITSYAVSLYNDETGHHSQICHYGIPYGGFAEPCNFDNKGDIPPSELPDASRLLHPGVSTLFEPYSVMLYPNSNPVFTATVSANSNAMPGTYWLSLQRSLCGPGVLAKLVVLP